VTRSTEGGDPADIPAPRWDLALLPAATPRAWLETHLRSFFRPLVDNQVEHRRVGVADLIADDARVLRSLHDHLVAGGASPRAAATYLSGWFGGLAATAIGYGLLGSGAGFAVDPAAIRWLVHPNSWTDAVELGDAAVVVPPNHPWSGRQRAIVLDDPAERRERIVAALVDTVRPIVEACHGLARVGKVGLWNEVGDGFAGALVDPSPIPVTEARAVTLRELIGTPRAPWKARAVMHVVETGYGAIVVMQKGGCCLAFTSSNEDAAAEGLDEEHREYEERFPDEPGAPGYCANCPRRALADCERRQVWWRTRELRREAAKATA
jgi:hypothetical protein